MQAVSSDETLHRLRRIAECTPNHSPGVFAFPWGLVRYVDAGQLSAQFEEIFIQRQYAFTTDSAEPVIVDCGGNVGLSAIWFKLNYPSCHLAVYEADPVLVEILTDNLRHGRIAGVTVHGQAVWTADVTVPFNQTGDDSGSIISAGPTKVSAIDLATRLPLRVDLLKMDIEGAEYSVLDRLCATGAIARVQRLVCEFHVSRDQTDAMLRTLTALRENGMEVSFHAAPQSWLGQADSISPFEFVGKKHVLMEVFAWRATCAAWSTPTP